MLRSMLSTALAANPVQQLRYTIASKRFLLLQQWPVDWQGTTLTSHLTYATAVVQQLRLGQGQQQPKVRLRSPTSSSPDVQLVRSVSISCSSMSSKKLINEPGTVVTDAIDGFLATNPTLQRLDGFPDIKVVFNPNHDKSKVALISGGGSGHEPAHIGYVGDGMLAAAVAGEVFASPPAAAVLAAIRTVTGPGGCLLVVKNYTGDRLNFGLAAEQAKAEGFAVELVVVGEDAAIDAPRMAGRRGLAGTALVHKIAGAAAHSGAPLDLVADVARRAASRCATLGVALTGCTLPGHPPNTRLGAGDVELGLGIHGEPGAAVMQLPAARDLVRTMLDRLVNYKPTSSLFAEPGCRVALLVNNLGATPPIEMSLVAGQAAAAAEEHGLHVVGLLCGPFMTSLDMAGVSITLLALQPDMEPLLAAATDAPGWPATAGIMTRHRTPRPLPLPKGPDEAGETAGGSSGTGSSSSSSSQGPVISSCIRAAAQELLQVSQQLNEIDAQSGDGDCGDTMASGSTALLAALDGSSINLTTPAAALRSIAATIQTAMGGTSGGLYRVALTAAAAAVQTAEPGLADWAAAFAAGVAAVEKYGGASAGCRTMLDALLPASEALLAAAQAGEPCGAAAATAAAAAAAAGADETKSMTAMAGRASYVPAEAIAGHPDPGAVAVSVWLRAVADTLKTAS